ncbi:MAG: hypothetical protein KGJ90_02055 [Patescibacteria group bacterium]|nr:hypothetical protein [Patescibacteria group bacterium]
MQPNFSILFSKTFWTIVAMFIVGGGNAIVPVLPPAVQAIFLGLLGILATYFHVNPSQVYNQGSIKN